MEQLKPYLETFWTTLNAQPAIAFFLNHSVLFLGLVACLACLGVGGMLFAGRILARKRKRSSYDKCARQLAFIAIVVGWLLAILCKTVSVLKTGLWFPVDLRGIFHETCWFLLVITMLYVTIYAFLWKQFAGKTLLQSLFSGVCFVQGFVTCLLVFCDARLFFLVKDAQTFHDWLLVMPTVLLPPLVSEAFLCLALLVPLFFLLPAVIGNIGLLFVRNRMDYGRDHYTIAIQWCSSVAVKWLTLACLLIAVHIGAILVEQWYAQAYDLLAYISCGILFALGIIALILYLCIAKSALPLRYKGTLVFADLLTIAFTCCTIYGWLN